MTQSGYFFFELLFKQKSYQGLEGKGKMSRRPDDSPRDRISHEDYDLGSCRTIEWL